MTLEKKLIDKQLLARARRLLDDGKIHSDAATSWAIEQVNAEHRRIEMEKRRPKLSFSERHGAHPW